MILVITPYPFLSLFEKEKREKREGGMKISV